MKEEQSQEPGRCGRQAQPEQGEQTRQHSWGHVRAPGSLPPRRPCDVGRGQGTHCCHSRGSRSHPRSREAAGAARASKAALWEWESGVGTQPLTGRPPPALPHPTGPFLLLWGRHPLAPGLGLLLGVLRPGPLGPPPAGGPSGRLLAPDVLNWEREWAERGRAAGLEGQAGPGDRRLGRDGEVGPGGGRPAGSYSQSS